MPTPGSGRSSVASMGKSHGAVLSDSQVGTLMGTSKDAFPPSAYVLRISMERPILKMARFMPMPYTPTENGWSSPSPLPDPSSAGSCPPLSGSPSPRPNVKA